MRAKRLLETAAPVAGGATMGLALGLVLRALPALGSPDLGALPWYLSRSAGLVAYLLLSLDVALGLLLTTGLVGPKLRPLAFELHRTASSLLLGFAGLHGAALLFDRTVPFSLRQVLVPFSADYRPLAVGLGTVAFYLAALLALSFALRRRLGPARWRALHYLSFPAYGLATLHAVGSGTDVARPAVQWALLGAGAVVLFLIYYRLLASRRPAAAQRTRPGTPAG